MKVIKIFLASSINEFKSERNELGRFILGINNLNLERGIYCHLELCENYDSSISARKRKQDDYNEFIKGSDAVFVLFCENAGDYTVEELKLAKNCFKENGKPKVYTYFKNFDENKLTDEVRKAYELIKDEYKHFFGTFESIAAIEVDILRAMFEICPNDALRVSEDNGIVYFGDEAIMSADELDYIKNNRAIYELKDRIAGLKSGDKTYIVDLWGYEIDEEIKICEKRLKERYEKSFKALQNRFEKMSNGVTVTYARQVVINAATRGDYNSILELLSLESIKLDAKKKEMEYDISQKQVFDDTFGDCRQLINALIQTNESSDKIEEAYDVAVSLIKKHHLYEVDKGCLDIWYDVVSFLDDINKNSKAIALGKELCRIYEFNLKTCTEYDKARLYNLLGMLFDNQNQPKDAEEYYLKAIDIIEKLVETNSEKYNDALAISYNNAGAFYDDQGEPKKAEDFYLRAIDIREMLVEINPEKYNGCLSGSYNNAGNFYINQGEPKKAEGFYLKAIDIHEKLVETNPDRYNGKLAGCYYNAGIFYIDQGEPKKAEDFYLKAIEIYEKLVEDNPEKYSGDLAMSYNNAGIFYIDQGEPKKAEDFYLKAIVIREILVETNSEKYQGDLASSYNNAGNFYDDQGDSKKAEDFYLKAIVIREMLVETNSEKYQGDLASSYNNAGVFYINQGDLKKAEDFYLKAIDIHEKLVETNPEKYNGKLAGCYYNAGIFYIDQGEPKKAEDFYLKAIDIYEKLVESNPEKYKGELAMSYNNAGIFYEVQRELQKSKEYYLKAIEIFEELAKKNPQKNNGALAVAYFNYAIFTKSIEYFKKSYYHAKTSMHNPNCRIIVERLKGQFE